MGATEGNSLTAIDGLLIERLLAQIRSIIS